LIIAIRVSLNARKVKAPAFYFRLLDLFFIPNSWTPSPIDMRRRNIDIVKIPESFRRCLDQPEIAFNAVHLPIHFPNRHGLEQDLPTRPFTARFRHHLQGLTPELALASTPSLPD
jgi:hypothetical protein